MSEQAGKLKKLQETTGEPFAGPPLCRSFIIHPASHLILQGAGALDFLFLHFTDEETETKGYEMTYTSVSCSRMWYARVLNLGQDDRKKEDSLLS